jgi:transposase-like protein
MLEYAGTREPATYGRGRRRPEAPPPGTRRWTARRKAQVVDAVAAGRLTLAAACRAYDLSPEELAAWKRALDRYGTEALKVTRQQGFRAAPVPAAAQASPVARGHA